MPRSRPINRWLLAVVLLAQLPIVADMTILHVAVPSLTLALRATGTEVLWIIDIYPLLMASLLVPMGTLADRIGPRRVLLTGLAVFFAASAGAAYAPSAEALIAARATMAVGAAMVIPSVMAIIRHTFDDPKPRAVALGLWSAAMSAGAAIGPLAGGLLLEHFWWGSVFLVNLPVILVLWPLVFALAPRREGGRLGEWSIGQALFLAAGLLAAVHGLKAVFRPGAGVIESYGALALGLTLLAAFVGFQLRAARPMLDLSLFSRPAMRAGLLMALVVSAALVGVELTLALELQFALGLTPLQAGLFMLPLMIAAAVGGPLAGVAVSATGLRRLSALSLLLAALAVAGLGLSDLGAAGLDVGVLLVVLGLSLSVGLTASSIAIMGSAPPDKAGAAGALEGTGYDLGAGLGVTAFGVLLGGLYGGALRVPADVPASLADQARRSIGETMIVAQDMGGAQGEALAQAGRLAFASAHSGVLLTAAAVVAVLAAAVYVLLRGFDDRATG